MKNEVSLMFSGGIDSTYAAGLLAEKYDKVHLLNYSNGYGHMFLGKSRKRYLELKKRFKGKFLFHYRSIGPLFKKILIDTLDSEMKKYSSAFIWCWSCKLSMHTESITYNILNDIKNASDGSSSETKEMVEQSPFSLSLVKKLYGKYGIRFEPVTYSLSRKEKIEGLKMKGIKTGVPFLNRNLGIQPKCIPGELYYSPYIVMKREPFHQHKEIYRFYTSKLPILEDYIQNETRKMGGG